MICQSRGTEASKHPRQRAKPAADRRRKAPGCPYFFLAAGCKLSMLSLSPDNSSGGEDQR